MRMIWDGFRVGLLIGCFVTVMVTGNWIVTLGFLGLLTISWFLIEEK